MVNPTPKLKFSISEIERRKRIKADRLAMALIIIVGVLFAYFISA